jgi:hypothetical protein
MKHSSYLSVPCIALSILICAVGSVRTMGGLIAVSDGSELPSEDGCLLAFAYNQKDDDRLVVIDEKNHRHYEAPMNGAKLAPFWEGGKVYVVDAYGNLQGFTVGSDRLIAGKEETISSISTVAVYGAEYDSAQGRLYLIRIRRGNQHKGFCELVAIDFATRKTLWTKRIDDPGELTIMEPYVCVMGLKLVQVFNCDTGEKLGEIEAVKDASKEANEHK